MRVQSEVAEAIGVFALVFCGCGAIMVNELTGALGHLAVNAVFGLTIAAMVLTVGHVSGSHFNPAITVAMAAGGYFPARRVVGYVTAQIAGGVAAAFLLRWLFGDVAAVGATLPAAEFDAPRVFAIEALLTFGLMYVMLGAAVDRRAAPGLAALALGGWVALAGLMAGPITGTSMNPARSIGPALASGATDSLVLYAAAAVAGALLATGVHAFVRRGAVPGSDDEAMRHADGVRAVLQTRRQRRAPVASPGRRN